MIYVFLLTWKERVECWWRIAFMHPAQRSVSSLSINSPQKRFNFSEKKPSIPKGHHVSLTFCLLWENPVRAGYCKAAAVLLHDTLSKRSLSSAPMRLLHFTLFLAFLDTTLRHNPMTMLFHLKYLLPYI